jgi:type III restriction enzyme
VTGALDNPVINGPFDPPVRHFEIGPEGPTGTVLDGRRPSESWIPIPAARKGKAKAGVEQVSLDFDVTGERREQNTLINDIRREVERWRLTYNGVTPITRKLLEHWADESRADERVLFCQREAAETAIYLAEVAHKQTGKVGWKGRVDEANAVHNADLPRVALKMATGSGKTVVMAMLIAWQTLNHAYNPHDPRYTDRFLVVTPGITIRNRLRVLLPSDDENYYRLRDLVPADLWPSLSTARVAITNYHTFLPRDRPEIRGVASRTRQILTQGKAVDPFKETDDDVVTRVLKDLGLSATKTRSGPRLMVLNDEAHHCYQDKPLEVPDKLDSETQERNAEARVWFKGLQAIAKRVGIKSIYDLSATPYYLGGSGYAEGFIFPWTVSDFSLMDAIESGIVKVPRFPVDDDATGPQVTYLRLWDAVGKELPKRRPRAAVEGIGWTPPGALQGAMESLYRSYVRSWEHYERELAAFGEPPPVFIVVCPNTAVSKLMYDWISGREDVDPNGDQVVLGGNLALFSNVVDGKWVDRPRALLIDSAQIESGESLREDFKQAAHAEIDTFKAEYRRRYPGADVDKLTDEDLLREVMNTVGKPGRLGGDVRCVVSVSMLTEGWDANTVTHVLGVRAFGSQLLCEQVVGRGLRRRSYALNEHGMFEPEYANVYGVPFSFIGGTPGPEPKPQPPALSVQSVEGREEFRIRFPKVEGYRLEIPDAELHFDLAEADRLVVRRDEVATWTQSIGIVGVSEDVDLSHYAEVREQEVAYRIAREVVDVHLRMGTDRRPWLFPRVVELTRAWLATHVELRDGLALGFLTLAEYQRQAAEAVFHAITTLPENRRGRLRPILRRGDADGDTSRVSFLTRKHAIPTAKSEVSHVVLDGPGGNTWEQVLAGECEQLADVAAYVKNDHLGLVIPYVHKGVTHSYVPDFLLRLRPREGDPVTRVLVVEVSGGQKSPGPTHLKARTARDVWCSAVNNHAGVGRWGYVEITDMPSVRARLTEAIELLHADAPIVGDPDLMDVVNVSV